ncbi:MAG: ribbon-helix-helix domain-containing protein [Sphingomonadaceae bacterium]|nr:hypothetical protein [Sphingomonadaceae bacterium]
MKEEKVDLLISIDQRTNIELKTYLAQQGSEQGDLASFVEDAVKWRMFSLNLAEIRKGFVDLSVEEIETLVADALASTQNS